MPEPEMDPIPRPAFLLGTAGLIPFVVLASALYALPGSTSPMLLFWLSAYSAVILSFVGAVHWGAALVHPRMRDSDRVVFMTWSAVPALTAWVSLLLPPKTGLLLMGASFRRALRRGPPVGSALRSATLVPEVASRLDDRGGAVPTDGSAALGNALIGAAAGRRLRACHASASPHASIRHHRPGRTSSYIAYLRVRPARLEPSDWAALAPATPTS